MQAALEKDRAAKLRSSPVRATLSVYQTFWPSSDVMQVKLVTPYQNEPHFNLETVDWKPTLNLSHACPKDAGTEQPRRSEQPSDAVWHGRRTNSGKWPRFSEYWRSKVCRALASRWPSHTDIPSMHLYIHNASRLQSVFIYPCEDEYELLHSCSLSCLVSCFLNT